MKWLSLPAAAVTAAAFMTVLTSDDVRAASPRSQHKPSHKKLIAARKPAYNDPIALPLQVGPETDARNSPYSGSAAPLSRGENIARTALAYRGMPYRFGGRSERSGFDCSGLVQAVCAKWGIYLPRVAGAQFTKGAPVSQGDLQPGDLVFFKNTYKAGLSHVGIFIGEGQFVHAAGRKKGVKISSLADAFYQHHWAGAKRLDLTRLPHAADEATYTPPQASDVTIEAPASLPARNVKAAWQPRAYHDDPAAYSSVDERMAGEGTTTATRYAPPRLR